jgi:hypothetical protein
VFRTLAILTEHGDVPNPLTDIAYLLRGAVGRAAARIGGVVDAGWLFCCLGMLAAG